MVCGCWSAGQCEQTPTLCVCVCVIGLSTLHSRVICFSAGRRGVFAAFCSRCCTCCMCFAASVCRARRVCSSVGCICLICCIRCVCCTCCACCACCTRCVRENVGALYVMRLQLPPNTMYVLYVFHVRRCVCARVCARVHDGFCVLCVCVVCARGVFYVLRALYSQCVR